MIEKKTPAGKPADDFIRIQDLWSMFVPKWYWFAISLFIALTIAVLYLLSTPPIYTRTAAILVKDNSKSSSSTGTMSDFSDLGIFKSNTNINNELLTLKSPTLMTEVVNRLGLNETFTVRKGLKSVDLYKVSPVTITFCDQVEVPLSFNIKFLSREAFAISELEIPGEDTGETLSAQMGDSIQTSAGTMIVSPTPEFTDAFIGTSVRYVRGSVRAAADTYANALVAELGNEDATIINLSINDVSIRKAEDILNTLIEVYNENWIRDKNQIAVSTSQFISDRLGVIESELGHVDENISSYKSEHLLPDVQAASSLYMAQSAENNKELSTLNNQLSTAQYIRRELNTKQLDQTLPANSGIVSANIETQISEYNNLVLDRNRLIANSSEKNPLVKNMASSLQSMQRTIIQSVDNLIVSLNTQIRSLRRQEEATTNRLASNPNQAKYLLSVERQQKVKEELYLYLLQKREENELSQAFTAYNTRLITAPRGSGFPTAPRKMNILLVAFAVGLLVPAVGIFMKENMNTKVRGRKDLENLSIPFIGEIPQYSGTKKKWWEFKHRKRQDMKTIVVNEGNRNIINEAFRVLRSNMDFMASKDSNQHVFVLTSFNPGSGKSFLAINIAMSFAIKKKKILVIDGDLRHRTVSSYVDSPDKGLSNYLNNQVGNWKEIVVPYKGYTNLHILPIGTVPPNPTELLEDSKLSMLIEALRPEYDYIFIDCPPVDIVADVQIIEKWADRTIFVVRSGLLDRSMLSELENMYTGKRFKNLSMILNGTESTGGRYGYRYGYHYGYASYYGGKDK
ncbi:MULTISPECIES: GumC family protein [Bacteroides]|uniref:GumC family protein n=1 Tax=Bacteroides TaxID=816 RepID=UPI001C3763A3|nr:MULTISPECIES: polysaccharide biosynthesis tyrosine autokinase [Bacteroides]MBV3639015.1 polysaccharide biosynthesis tyrosine autokinase [Bacteroides cellulosilyticus]MBV3665132.1 polysaccharide biosynthesis tyrosine autokinase [Bacteroides cellulosilyticus]MBV3687110.1 polysaccharide biosynthesis tyrosine autokinase [Bacteroides cellulosilyticus]MBV3695854.1 polysaccharide biosynthesis tyrosine autokinase [Bacteroides cellulosilyticus]MBV3709423.1 polysaccharide biosynthesis tyrosine autoki